MCTPVGHILVATIKVDISRTPALNSCIVETFIVGFNNTLKMSILVFKNERTKIYVLTHHHVVVYAI